MMFSSIDDSDSSARKSIGPGVPGNFGGAFRKRYARRHNSVRPVFGDLIIVKNRDAGPPAAAVRSQTGSPQLLMHPGREANAGNARTTVTARNIYVPESATNPPSIRRRPDRWDGVFCYDERRFYG